MITVHQQYDVKPYFRAYAVAEDNVKQLEEICLYFTSASYTYLSIEDAVKLRNVINDVINEAMIVKQTRYEKAVADLADLTSRGMGEVSE